MGALIGLIPLIAQAIPSLIPLFATPVSGNLVTKAGEIAQKIFGTTDPAIIQERIAADTNAMERFKAELQAATASDIAWYNDIASARSMQVAALQAGSNTQWIPVAITGMIFGLFALAFLLTVQERISVTNSPAQQMVGAIIAAFSGAWGYWLGSSRSAATKDSTISDMASTAVTKAVDAASSTVGRMFK